MTLKTLSLLFVAAARLSAADSFHFTNVTDKSRALFEGDRPVFVYNHGVIAPPPGVPADRARSSYIHPLYGLDGEMLTDDFPKDHYHHRGLFWAWPRVRSASTMTASLMLDSTFLRGTEASVRSPLARRGRESARP